jgi:DNA-binding NarL/FixJ family response regulator
MRGHLHSVDARFPAPGRSIRIALADDHAALRRTLRLLLEREDDMKVVGEAGNLATLMHLVGDRRPAVLVLDLRMRDGSVDEMIQRLREESPRTEIVIITMHESRMLADQVLKAGAMGFVLKDRADVELCDGVRRAARGLQYTSPRLA